MSIALRLSSLFPKPRYDRRPRVTADRHARAAMSRDKRWKRRSDSGFLRTFITASLIGLGTIAALAFINRADTTPVAPPLAFPDLVAEAESAFPEALRGHTRAQGGTLSDGREVPTAISLLLPAHALTSADAAPDALTRLSAPFVGREPSISGTEMGNRIARLARAALPDGISSCYSYETTAPRRIVESDIRTRHVTPLTILFNPEC